MMRFTLNGYVWNVIFVKSNDTRLVDRTGVLTVGTTDPKAKCIYLSRNLNGSFLVKVLLHEIAHAIIVSYDLTDDIHRFVYPDKWIEAEECLCNYIANYGIYIYNIAYGLLGNNAIYIVPSELDRQFMTS